MTRYFVERAGGKVEEVSYGEHIAWMQNPANPLYEQAVIGQARVLTVFTGQTDDAHTLRPLVYISTVWRPNGTVTSQRFHSRVGVMAYHRGLLLILAREQDAATQAPDDVERCAACNQPQADGDRYCVRCGARLDSMQGPTEPDVDEAHPFLVAIGEWLTTRAA